MDSNLVLNIQGRDVRILTDYVAGVHQLKVATTGAAGGGLTDAELRADPVAVEFGAAQHVIIDSMPAGGSGLTDAELRATPVEIEGIIAVSNFPSSFSISNFPGSQPVTGTFWQATQPVSGPLTDAQLRATAVSVSGTFWQATQPVSGPLTDAQLRATAILVSGTFWQATQPVSGTFWQATQPVSGPVTDAQLRATAVPVSLAALPALVAGNANIGDVDIASVPTLTKSTQGSTGFSVQNLKDAGRDAVMYFMAAPIITTNAEVMMSLTGYKGGVAVAATATPAVVTTGKRFRLQLVRLTYVNVATIGSARFTLRANLSGVAVIGSPLVCSWQVGISGDGTSTAGHVTTVDVVMPDNFEFAAGTGIALGMQGFGAVPSTAAAVGYGKAELMGYEY